MKNTRAMLSPVNTRKMLAIEMPITAANSQKVICAALALIDLDAGAQEEHEAQRRQHHHPLQGRGEDRHVEAPGVDATASATRPVIASPRPI